MIRSYAVILEYNELNNAFIILGHQEENVFKDTSFIGNKEPEKRSKLWKYGNKQYYMYD